MVAVPASLPSCAFCQRPLEGGLAPHLCALCGTPQPRLPGETFFSALGAPEKFGQDVAALQLRFYELSRALHPDRFARAESQVRKASLERMSFLNEAFEFLRSREALREHFFSTHAISCGGGGGPWMMELSERWFDVQDQAETEPSVVFEFGAELERKQQFLAAKIEALESRFDGLCAEPEARQVLEEIQMHSLSQNTLKSMIRDVQRLKARLGIG